MRFEVLVEVKLKSGIADPQGATIERALPTLGYATVTRVRVGKAIRFDLDAIDAEIAGQQVEDMCRRFLTNPVIEDAAISIVPVS